MARCTRSLLLRLLLAGALGTTSITGPTCAGADTDPWNKERTLFLDAEKAFRRGDKATYRSLAARLTDYPLYPYLRYNRLAANLGPGSYEEVERFVAEYAHTPLAGRLRGKWLDELAKREQWQRYLTVFEDDGSVSRQCHHHYAQLRHNDRVTAFAGARRLWMHGESRPKACDKLFSAWHRTDDFRPEDAAARVELAMATGEWRLARYLKRFLPEDGQAAVEQWVRLHQTPVLLRTCGSRNELLHRATSPAIAHGLIRLARRDPPGALVAFREIDPVLAFSEPQRQAVMSAIVSRYASRDLAGTDELLRNTPAALLDDAAREGRMRWAVRRDRLQLLPGWFYDLPETSQESTRWRYWRARAWEDEGKAHEAELALRELALERDYYGFLAADRVGAEYSFNHRPLEPSPEQLATVRDAGFVIRARELRLLDRHTAARREWWHGLRDADDQTIDAAIVVAGELGWHRIVVLTASRARRWDDIALRFPVAYDQEIARHAARHELPEEILISLARRESAFDRFARSGAGARGLLQVMPATGRQIARQLGEPWTSAWALYDAETNLRFGSHYLAGQIKRFNGQLPLALAAYNGGPHNVSGWLRFDGTLPAERWIETIPFRETREYVQAILAYAMLYRAQLDLPPQRMTRYLKPVAGTGAIKETATPPVPCNR